VVFPPEGSIRTPADAAGMSPDERLDDVAAILALGVLRLHMRACLRLSGYLMSRRFINTSDR